MTYRDAYLMQPEQVPELKRDQVLRLQFVTRLMRGLIYEHGADMIRDLNRQLPQRVGLAQAKAHTLALMDACELYLEERC
jgi:hypothetical protein